MKRISTKLSWCGVLFLIVGAVAFAGCATCSKACGKCDADDGWISLFDGESLDGWKVSENKDTFTVRDGMIVVHGTRSHLYYVGPVQDANFKNFEFKADVMTTLGANSGIYFHTVYQETGWPKKGYECQVSNSYATDPQRTGGLYDVSKVLEAPAKDNEWYTQHITVNGQRIMVKIDGKTVVDYTEPADIERPEWPGRKLSSGTFALQGHDPESLVYYKNIRVKPLP